MGDKKRTSTGSRNRLQAESQSPDRVKKVKTEANQKASNSDDLKSQLTLQASLKSQVSSNEKTRLKLLDVPSHPGHFYLTSAYNSGYPRRLCSASMCRTPSFTKATSAMTNLTATINLRPDADIGEAAYEYWHANDSKRFWKLYKALQGHASNVVKKDWNPCGSMTRGFRDYICPYFLASLQHLESFEEKVENLLLKMGKLQDEPKKSKSDTSGCFGGVIDESALGSLGVETLLMQDPQTFGEKLSDAGVVFDVWNEVPVDSLRITDRSHLVFNPQAFNVSQCFEVTVYGRTLTWWAMCGACPEMPFYPFRNHKSTKFAPKSTVFKQVLGSDVGAVIDFKYKTHREVQIQIKADLPSLFAKMSVFPPTTPSVKGKWRLVKDVSYNDQVMSADHLVPGPQASRGHDRADDRSGYVSSRSFNIRKSIDQPKATTPDCFLHPLIGNQPHTLSWMYSREGRSLDGHMDVSCAPAAFTCHDTISRRLAGTDIKIEAKMEKTFHHSLGGVLADQIGYGKTACMIALIAHSLQTDPVAFLPLNDTEKRLASEHVFTQASLVVVPPNLMTQWRDEVSKFVDITKRRMTVLTISTLNDLKRFKTSDFMSAHIVLISVNILLSETYQLYFDQVAYGSGSGSDAVVVRPAETPKDKQHKKDVKAWKERNPGKSVPNGFKYRHPNEFTGFGKGPFWNSKCPQHYCSDRRRPENYWFDNRPRPDRFDHIEEEKEKRKNKKQKFNAEVSKAHEKNLQEAKYTAKRFLKNMSQVSTNLKKNATQKMLDVPALFESFYWKRVIFDELHEYSEEGIRHDGTIRDKLLAAFCSLRNLQGRYHWGLTATPPLKSARHISNMSSLLHVFVPPHNHGEAQHFLDEYVRANQWDVGKVPLEEKLVKVQHTRLERSLYKNQAGIYSGRYYRRRYINGHSRENEDLLKYCTFFSPDDTDQTSCESVIQEKIQSLKRTFDDLKTSKSKTLQDRAAQVGSQLRYLENAIKSTIEDDTPQECLICLEEDLVAGNAAMTPCGHVFHEQCIQEVIDSSDYSALCPTCRAEISMDSLTSGVDLQMKEPVQTTEQDLRRDRLGSKIAAVVDLIESIKKKDPKDKVVVFVQWNEIRSKIADAIAAGLGYAPLTLDGDAKKRSSILDKFISGRKKEYGVLLLSLQNSASGMNLTCANHCVLVHPMFGSHALDYEKQAIGRIRRQGQKKTCYLYRFYTENTIEEKLMKDHSQTLQNIELPKEEEEESESESDVSDEEDDEDGDHDENPFVHRERDVSLQVSSFQPKAQKHWVDRADNRQTW